MYLAMLGDVSLSVCLRKWDRNKVIKGMEKGSVINFMRLIDGGLAQDLLRVSQGPLIW